MSSGFVGQRHLRSCPRDAEGALLPHRCRGNWFYTMEGARRGDGRRQQIHRGGFKSKREAQAALREELARRHAGLADIRGMTLLGYLESWLDGKRNLRDTTRRSYRMHIHRYLGPGLGGVRLSDLGAHHIDRLYQDMLAGKYAGGATPATVRAVHRTLRSALNTAVKRRLIPWNPALHVELPSRPRPRTLVWSPEQLAAFLGASRTDRLAPLFHVMAFTGLRRGEALGLHWADVDLDRAHLAIHWQVIDAGTGPQLGAPKTAAGSRVVPIDGGTVRMLRRHRVQQQHDRLAWGRAWQDLDLVFSREDGGLLRPDVVTHRFLHLVAKAEVPRIRLHDLRHTHASLALAAGVDIKIVSDRLGHSSTVITADLYTHVVPAVARQAANDIADLVPLLTDNREPDVTPALPHEAVPRGARGPPPGETAGQT